VPFDNNGDIDKNSLCRVVRFELEGGVQGIGINGFASEAYKLTDDERRHTIDIVSGELAGQVPLIIGLAATSTEAVIQQAKEFAKYSPACYMVLPPSTMDNGPKALLKHYRDLAVSTDIAIMVQQSPHIPAYTHCLLSPDYLAELSTYSGIDYFKIEGPGAPERMAALRPLVDLHKVGLFGGVGGITFIDELEAGAAGVIPGVGFNEVFIQAWVAWQAGNKTEVKRLLEYYQPLIGAVSGKGHEFSLHARKHLMKRAGYIQHPYVRRPTIETELEDIKKVTEIAKGFSDLRIAKQLKV
jgi:dihydrodipicolinate synthase/N-acetylneuraminate lyase